MTRSTVSKSRGSQRSGISGRTIKVGGGHYAASCAAKLIVGSKMDDSPLARLPAELRNRIYELVLLYNDGVRMSMNYRREWQPPALLHASRQVRAESSSIYYAHNTFQFLAWASPRPNKGMYDEVLVSWLRTLDAPSRASIRTINLHDGFYHEHDVDRRIQMCRKRLEKAGVRIKEAEIVVNLINWSSQ